jgi:hypothetical protein
MRALELPVRLLLGLCLFQRDDLRLGQDQALLGHFSSKGYPQPNTLSFASALAVSRT